MSVVINLYGGSGLGKSTTAALIFGELKLMGKEAELVMEYAKEWAWEGRRITPDDQEHISDEQFQREERLYNKVNYVVTDSPLLLGPVYEKFYSGEDKSREMVLNRMREHEKNGVRYVNFFLSRNKPFNPKGRFETEDQARSVDKFLHNYLVEHNIPFEVITSNDRERVHEIIQKVLEI